MPFDIDDIISYVETITQLIFGNNAPSWISPVLGGFLLLALILVAFLGFLEVVKKIMDRWKQDFQPMFYSEEEKRRVVRRRRFADHVEAEIRRLNSLEEWRDYRFAELEAEVEAEGRQRISSLLPLLSRSRSGLRREKSLSKALETSQERLILVEGEPGSGKSVALRHVAQSMAHRAMKARSAKSVIPIYINLKELKVPNGELIDKNLIQTFVLRSLNRANDRDIEEFLESEFDKGLEEGTWLFLFDSFDEIPDILSSTEADTIIRTYSDAISYFLHGLNACRGILASRQFRGPEQSTGQSRWPRFRILQLSESRRAELVRKADLDPVLQKTIVGHIGIAGDEIRGMASNPMFLGLLCEYMRTGNPFPQNAHSVFETYIDTRLKRDEERLKQRFKLKPAQIRSTAESIAFCMAADRGLGLTPTRENLTGAMRELGFRLPKNFGSHLDALEYIKLARSETATVSGDSKPFTFAHRRFQEYFATCIVLNEQKRVTPRFLLTDARWRETAVVICQTQPAELLEPIIKEARKIMVAVKKSMPELIDLTMEDSGQLQTPLPEKVRLSSPFVWPPGLLHIAGLLQDGFVNHLKDLPIDIRQNLGQILWTASKMGTLFDRKWSLEVAGTVPFPVLVGLLREAFASSSQWLSDVAFRQTARLSEIPDDIARSIRLSLVGLFAAGRLGREQHATHAHLARLPKSADFIDTLRLLLWISPIDVGIFLLLSIVFIPFAFINGNREGMQNPTNLLWVFPSLLLLILLSYASLGPLAEFYRAVSARGFKNWQKNSNALASMMAVIAVEVRFVLLPMLPVIALPFASLAAFSSINLIIWIWIVYLLIIYWAPVALGAAIAGQFTNPVWWLFIPLWPLFYFIGNIQKSLKAIWSGLKKYWIYIFLWSVLFGLGIGYADKPLVQTAWIVFMVASSVIGLIFIASSLFFWISDWMNWSRWKRKRVSSMTGRELLLQLTEYRYDTFRNRFVKAVREQGLLIAGDETEMLTKRLALEIEHAMLTLNKLVESSPKHWQLALYESLNNLARFAKVYQLRKKSMSGMRDKDQSKLSSADFFEAWLADYQQGNPGKLAQWGSEFLDEIWRLSEQVEKGRTLSGKPQFAVS